MQRAAKATTALLMAAVGLGFSANSLAAGGTDLRSQRVADLKSLVLARANDVESTEATLQRLRREVNDLAIEYSTPELTSTRAKISKLKPTLGLRSMVGEGLVVTLDDAKTDPSLIDPDLDPNWLLVHQQDIEAVINALWQGGAKGVTVMGQRITSTSAVRCVGSTVLVNGKVFSPPFTIIGVGNIDKLHSALADDQFVDYYRTLAKSFGLTYLVEEGHSLYLPAYSGSISVKYAGPLD